MNRKPETGNSLRRSADRALRLRRQIRKSRRIFHRQVRQNLAVQFDPRNLQPVVELVELIPFSLAAAPMRTIHNERYCRFRCLRPE